MKRTILALLMLLPMLAMAQVMTEVIEPRHRPAQELAPLLQPLAGAGGSVSTFDNKLVVRAAPAQIAEMRRLLEQLDRAPRQMMVSVRQGRRLQSQEQEAGLSGVYRRGDGSVSVPGPDGRTPQDVELRLRESQVVDSNGISQQLRVTEGYEAQITLGRSRPYTVTEPLTDGKFAYRTEYIEYNTGFTVLPRIQGDRVQLEISAQQQIGARPGYTNSRGTSSNVSGSLGEWFEIGSAVQQAAASSGAVLGYGEHSSQAQDSVQVRVELLE